MSYDDLFTQEREQIILDLLNEKKRITVKELAEMFMISSSSIRRDLNLMEKAGKLLRTHGGAMIADVVPSEEIIEERRTKNIVEKQRIAKRARSYIQDGDIFILGSGTTTLELAKLLHDLKNAVIITNSIIIANELYKNVNIEVQICGGTIRSKTATIIGPASEQFLKNIVVEKVFIGADAISLDHGITTPNSLEAVIEKKLIECGKKVFVLADYSKMDTVTLAPEFPLSDVDCLITDDKADDDFIEKMKKTGVEVEVVQPLQP